MYKRKLNGWFILAVMVLGILFMGESQKTIGETYLSTILLLFGVLLFVMAGLTHCVLSEKNNQPTN